MARSAGSPATTAGTCVDSGLEMTTGRAAACLGAGELPQARRAPSSVPRCRNCRKRQVQFAGLCRSCGRLLGVYTKTTRDAEAERLEKQQTALTPRYQAPASTTLPRPVVIDGVEFD